MKYEIRRVRVGEEQQWLDKGYEPFGISPHDTSYQYLDTTLQRYMTHHQTTDFIYLRKKVKEVA
jgi:hypothetical protein